MTKEARKPNDEVIKRACRLAASDFVIISSFVIRYWLFIRNFPHHDRF